MKLTKKKDKTGQPLQLRTENKDMKKTRHDYEYIRFYQMRRNGES
jgi:hypothetical protein